MHQNRHVCAPPQGGFVQGYLRPAVALVLLVAQNDLLAPTPALPPELAEDVAIARSHAAVARLRELAATLLSGAGVRAPAPAREYRIAQLRYSAHTLGFDECDLRQKRFALASTCLLAERLA